MTFLDIVYTIFIRPLLLFFEVLFMMANRIIDNPGMSIIVLSLAMNFLVLPLYRRADAMQEEERDIETKLHKGVAHIKKTFKGDERMMILNAYYRQNDYKPTYVFKGAMSLFLEIPFFIAAYQFLSNLEILQGVPFGVLQDLGAADQLITIGSYHVNLLPIIMTAVNLISCVIFTKGYPVKTKVQLYSMAIFFFFFLYSSPSGLVFYWTLNNVFSLVKTIFYKLRHARQILEGMFGVAGTALIIAAVYGYHEGHMIRLIGIIGIGVICILPLFVTVLKKYCKLHMKPLQIEANGKLFLAGAIFLVVLVGALIPSAVINASPQEFVDVHYYLHPIWFICSSLCFAIGTFIVWLGVFYRLANKKTRVFFDIAVWLGCGIATINYMFFGKNLGILSNILKFEEGMCFDRKQILINIAILCTATVIMFVIFRFGKKLVPQVLLIGSLALAGMTISNVVKINRSVADMADAVSQAQDDTPSFTLSKTGKNVIVLMMDRAMNEYIPYFMNEKPELKEQFAGFTYYSNTVSFGGFTNFGTPALYGGYEYTPVELNKRNTESLATKQNEALKVMPALFDENGYNVTICDPTYTNYQWTADFSIYDDYPDIHTYITNGRFADKESKQNVIKNNKRNFFCYSIMKSVPLCIQSVLYDNGAYNQGKNAQVSDGQIMENNYVATGTNPAFQKAYSVLENLKNMTDVRDDGSDNFLLMTNDTTHEPMLLQEPDYVPSMHVDNAEYESKHSERYTVDEVTLNMNSDVQYIHYQTNMAAMIQLGNWMDYLRENDVYDNTKIIIVADHGRPLYHLDEMVLDDGSNNLYNTEFYYPLLMVKDFNQKEFATSEEFMTNGDVPTLAFRDTISDPVNPFTGKEINNSEKYTHDQYILGSKKWDISENNGNTYLPGSWLSVHDDMRKKDNWTILNENSISPTENETK